MRCLQCQNVFVAKERAVPSDAISTSPRTSVPPAEIKSRDLRPEDDLGPRPARQFKRTHPEISGYLWPLAALPWGLLLLALGGCLWGAVGGFLAAILSAGGMALMRARWISVSMRVAGLLALDGVAFLIGIVALAVWTIPMLGPGGGADGSSTIPLTGPWDKNVQPPKVTEVFAGGPRVYLADLQEFGVRSGPWQFGKDGTLGSGQPIQVAGVRSRKSLSMHPPWAPAYAAARYRLGRKAALFRATVAINDTTNWCWSPAYFTVLADGKPLWQSKPISFNMARSQECSLDISGVDVMELRVHCANGSDGVHAVWFEPRVLQSADTPDERPTPALFAAGPRAWLADMDPIEVQAGPWPLSNNGTIGPDRKPIIVDGVRSPKGLGLHPPDAPGSARACYQLAKQAAVFKTKVALNNTAAIVHSQAVFEVYGDGKSLWQSAPVGRIERPQECAISVSGVDVLELRVFSKGSHLGLHAVWLEPRLLQAADTPDR
jgi:hypothetical protein